MNTERVEQLCTLFEDARKCLPETMHAALADASEMLRESLDRVLFPIRHCLSNHQGLPPIEGDGDGEGEQGTDDSSDEYGTQRLSMTAFHELVDKTLSDIGVPTPQIVNINLHFTKIIAEHVSLYQLVTSGLGLSFC